MVPQKRWLIFQVSRENKEVKRGGRVARWRFKLTLWCCHRTAEVLCLTHVSLCFPTGVKRGHSTSEMSCQRSPHVSPHISLKQDWLCPFPPPVLFFFFLLSLIIFQLEVGQELVLSLRAGLWIYKLIDAGEYNAQATDVITTLIKTITAAYGCHSWGGMSSLISFSISSHLDVLLHSVRRVGP